MGLERLLRGVLKYRRGVQKLFLSELQEASANPHPSAVFISCMDSRLSPNEFLLTKAGDMFVIRNAGNMAPKEEVNFESAVAAGVDLGCVRNSIQHVIVCGHSDCKAMALLWSLRDSVDQVSEHGDALREWVRVHGRESLLQFVQHLSRDTKQPITLQSPNRQFTVKAIINRDNSLTEADQLSQLHCLQQMVNISGYAFMQQLVLKNKVRLSAMWFDARTADVLMFSKQRSKFIVINDDSVDEILSEWRRLDG